MAKRTGKAGSMTWNSTVIPITECNHKVAKTMADSTDSDDYSVSDGQLYKSQIPGDNQLTLSVKGYFDSIKTPTNIYVAMKSDATVAITTKIDGSNQVVSGTFDVQDWESTVTAPGGVMVDYACTLLSNGAYTLGN